MLRERAIVGSFTLRLARYWAGGTVRLGMIVGEELLDLADCAPEVPRTMTELLLSLPRHRPLLERLERSGKNGEPLSALRLAAPVEEPRRFIAVGLNYREHARELGQALPARPRLFVKLAGALTGPFEPVAAPEFSATLDYEVELAFVIGQRCRAIPRERALEVIAGYVVLNDLSVREYVNADQIILGKGCAGFAPCGPWLTTAEEVPDPQGLQLRTWVNGELRQDASTEQMIFDCASLIEYITRAIELEPGDLITTGSPPGSGAACRPPAYLRVDDVVRTEVAGLGALQNLIVAERTGGKPRRPVQRSRKSISSDAA
ncbi:MAG TPA: fumarylacetoacetate hydrolase family protein [Steroidobacteraceae bacterium]|nr:fumarylacetoacetate hydrolase family protein [Steroidobacteraceae bacterium]